MESGCLCHSTKREKVREEEGVLMQQRWIDGNSSVYNGIVPPSAGAGAEWKLSPSDSQAAGEVVGIEYPKEEKREMVY